MLGDQQWYPTSVQVTVLQARNLRIKGKNGTNDAYAIMQVGKDKFSTSVAEKSVAPVWKEEATFDLPMVQQDNADRCTLYIIVMHRALVGLDKFLGQAVINLVDLHANKSRNKTDWYKLVEKNGKIDKDRGEVFLDIQYMRNNMTASMFDLSMTDKPRSGISKLKDKIRKKKKDGFSDSASAIVSVAGSDSEGEGVDTPDSHKKKSKIKSLFGSKTNLHRNVSQSMSTLGTLPEKNSPLSLSRSSGLNVDSPDVKKKFKILGHKRNGSTDSKVSLGPFSLLSRSKQNVSEQNNLCINGSHVYAEDQDPNSGSTLSLNNSEKGSVEDLRKNHQRNISDVSADSLKGLSIPSYKAEDSIAQQRPLEDRNPGLQMRRLEGNEDKAKKPDGRILLEEQEKRIQQEREKQQAEERKRKLEEQEKKRKEEEELQKKRREEEEQRHQEENRVTDRLSSLFGIGKKKEEKKEEASTQEPKHLEAPSSINPFEEIPLTSDSPFSLPEDRSADPRMDSRIILSPMPPAFSNRTAKVSAVKPRLAASVLPDTDNSQSHLSPNASTLSPSLPKVSIGMLSDLHSSLAPPKPPRSFSESPRNSMEDLSGIDYAKKRRAPVPPGYPTASSKTESYNLDNGIDYAKKRMAPVPPGGQVQTHNPKDSQKPSIPLPDYDILYPKKRHGVVSQTRWDHVIAEVNQRNWDFSEETNVDGPEPVSYKPVVLKDRTSASLNQQQKNQEAPHPATSKHKEPLTPPKPALSASSNSPYPSVQSRYVPHGTERKAQSTEDFSRQPALAKEIPTPAARSLNLKTDRDSVAEDVTKEMPVVKPRQRSVIMDPVGQDQLDKQVSTYPVTSESKQYRGITVSAPTKNGAAHFNMEALDEADSSKMGNRNKKSTLEDQGVIRANTSANKKTTDPFTKIFENSTAAKSENKSTSFTEQARATFQRNFSFKKNRQYPTSKVMDKIALDRTVSQSSNDDVELTVTSVGPPSLTEPTLETFDPSVAGLSGGQNALRAWVSPSEAQSNSRRPHPVKPLSATESQSSSPLTVGKDLKTLTIKEMAEKSKNTDGAPYTQLTQEELITLVVKQQDELSKKDVKIGELEEYIDNLLVRVIDENPSILLSLQSKC
nr:rab11 family-interacting protein 1 [Misgurnus anguillicaudatus]